jgi:DNA-binding NarL/FixJ family response regulator
MKILVVDDHSIVRKGLIQIVEEMIETIEVDEAQNGDQAIEFVNNKNYNIVILDISMPGKDGLEVLSILKAKKPNLHVLMLSTYSEDIYAIRSIKAGASGYLDKASAPNELVKAIIKIANGGRYISSHLAEKIAISLDDNFDKLPHEKLSKREFEVFRLIAHGFSVKEISSKLFLSPKTISTYRTRILEKMMLKNNSEIIHYAISNHIVID